MRCFRLVLSALLFCGSLAVGQSITLSGYVYESGSRESLPGASVSVAGKRVGGQTNAYGYYALILPAQDSVVVRVSMVGYATFEQRVFARRSAILPVFLTPQVRQLPEVRVAGVGNRPAQQAAMSVMAIPVEQIKDMPVLLGEKDVIKALQLLPGVQKGNEGQTGLYVRGGGPDQNLLILDDAVVYNASHLFGFFSVFNTDALKNVELTKGGFPARYGGRLSSVVSMQMKEGNREKFHGEGGIGLIAGRLMLEGPLKKNRSSFLVSARRTYADALLRPLSGGSFPALFFYDINAKVNYDFGPKNKLYLSGYFGRDAANFSEKALDGSRTKDGFNWGNTTATLRWNHLLSTRLFLNTSLIYSRYAFNVFSDEGGLQSKDRYFQQYSSGIRDYTLKADADWLPGPAVSIKAGAVLTAHRFTPSAFVVRNINTDSVRTQSNPIDAIEGGLYAEALLQPVERLRINAGLRLSYFGVNGKQYLRPEPRLSLAWLLPGNWAAKASFAQMNQYIHLLSNSGLGLPTDLWVPATERIAPQQATQWAVGVAKDFVAQQLSLTVEGYYKTMQNIIGYREGANFLVLDIGPDPRRVASVDWQSNVTTGTGRSYGVEGFLQRKTGGPWLPKLTGWIGYTLSWTTNQFPDINGGRPFWARFDRRHDLSVVGIYQVKPRLTLSATFVYGTGNALTIPLGTSEARAHSFFGVYDQTEVSVFGERNAFRAAPYHRLDLAIRFLKPKRWGERVWEIGVYNAYNRINPYYYKSRTNYSGGSASGSYTRTLARYGLFPIIPHVSYAFKF